MRCRNISESKSTIKHFLKFNARRIFGIFLIPHGGVYIILVENLLNLFMHTSRSFGLMSVNESDLGYLSKYTTFNDLQPHFRRLSFQKIIATTPVQRDLKRILIQFHGTKTNADTNYGYVRRNLNRYLRK